MATRQKTIEFLTQTSTTIRAAAVPHEETITVYIPETVVAFRSVRLMGTYVISQSTAATPTGQTLALQIGANPINSGTLGSNISNSGERYGNRLVRDLTTEFTNNWSGTSQSVLLRVSAGTTASSNHAFKLSITYDYDDTATTHIKTVRIPIESTRATLTAAAQTLGGATAIPALANGYFPENSVVIRNAVVELYGNEVSSSADTTLRLNYGGDADVDCWVSVNTTINSDCFVHAMYNITGKALTSATALNAYATNTGRFGNLGGWITVTYEFNASTSTTIYNSLLLGAFDTAGWMGGTTSGDQDAWGRDIFIEEPDQAGGGITLMESGILLTFIDSGGFTCNVSVGAQANQAYTVTTGSLQCCNYSLMHRIDAGGQRGTAFASLARGRNSYLARVYSGTSQAGWSLAGCLILNYTSGKATAGVGVHAQSRLHLVSATAGSTTTTQTTASAPTIPETAYWLVGACVELSAVVAASASGAQAVQAERQSGEGEGTGWEPLYVGSYRADSEVQNVLLWGASRSAWKRWPNDADAGRMDIETARAYRVDTNPLHQMSLSFWYTYHAHTFSISGTVSGSSGGTVTLTAHRASDGEKIAATERSGNGAYSMTWYDNTENVFVEARESGTLLGRSDDGVAT